MMTQIHDKKNNILHSLKTSLSLFLSLTHTTSQAHSQTDTRKNTHTLLHKYTYTQKEMGIFYIYIQLID